MSLSTNQIIGILTILAAIWGTTYMYSPEIVRTEFNPPNEIYYSIGSILHFELTNHGEKTGSYFLSMKSEEILISKKQINSLDDYKHNISLSYLIPKDANNAYNFYLKVNKTNLKPNATISLIYIDKSGFNPFKKEYIWNFYYELDSLNNYQLKYEEYYEETIFLI